MSNEYNLQDKTNPFLSEMHLQRSSSVLPSEGGISSFNFLMYDLSRGQNLEDGSATGLGAPLVGEEGIYSSVSLEPGNNFKPVFSTNLRSADHIAAYSFNGIVRKSNTVNVVALIEWNVGWTYIDTTFVLEQSDLNINQGINNNKVIEPNTVGSGGIPINYNYPSVVGGNYVNFNMTLLNNVNSTQSFYIQGILEYWVISPFSTS